MVIFYFDQSINFIVYTYFIPVKNVFDCNIQIAVPLLFIPVYSTIWSDNANLNAFFILIITKATIT